MEISGELTATFDTCKKFKTEEFIKGCSVLCDYGNYKVNKINSHNNYNDAASIKLVTKDGSVNIDVYFIKNEKSMFSKVTIMIYGHGEYINTDYLNSTVTLVKSAFILDEVLTK